MLKNQTSTMRWMAVGQDMDILSKKIGLIKAIDQDLHLPKRHLPYHESDHPNPKSKIKIRKVNVIDLDAIIDIHQAGFSGFFLTFLGPLFLRELYLSILSDSSGIFLAAERKGRICGFVAGTTHPGNFYRRLVKKRWWKFALASLVPLVKRPSIALRLIRALNKPKLETNKQGRGTLMSIAVSPDVKGLGIGEALTFEFLKKAGGMGIYSVDLTTDRDNNEAVNNFYQNLGFVFERTFTTPEGRTMNEYVISLGKQGQ